MIELENVSFSYPGGTRVFDEFSWCAAAGEAWTVLGPSGCGKSTMLYLLAGLRRPQAGHVRVMNEVLIRARPRTGLILQDYGLLPWATVQENVALGLRIRAFYGPDGRHAPMDEGAVLVEERSAIWLERLGLLPLANKYPGQLSGGQRQRTAIARTMALEPDLLLMDEPFAALDVMTREELFQMLFDLRGERLLSTVIVTHSIEDAARLGEKVLLLRHTPNRDVKVVLNPLYGRKPEDNPSGWGALTAALRGSLEQET